MTTANASDFDKAREKAIIYQNRAREKQLKKINSPEHKEKEKLKKIAAIKKKQEKQRSRPYKPVSTKPQKPLVTRKPLNSKSQKPIKTKGLKGVARSKAEINLHDKMAALGCICCINANLIIPFSNSPVSIHHFAGRVVDGAHKKVLPLCAAHHDTPLPKKDSVNYPDVFPIHAKGKDGGKVRWEKVNGTQEELLKQTMSLIA
jgi:hypothetical protein